MGKKWSPKRCCAISNRKKAYTAFVSIPMLLGRDLFNFRPELMLGDDAEADDMTYEREDSDDEGEAGEGKENGAAKSTVKEIALDEFAFDMDKVCFLISIYAASL